METALLILFILAMSFYCIIIIVKWWKDIALIRKVTNLHRGTRSERNFVLRLLKGGFTPDTIFHDLYVEKQDGNFSQIDVAVISKIGIIIFEIKDYSGWLFGKGYQKYWTQVLNYGREKHRFYNPIIQNSNHIHAIKERIKPIANIPFYSIIVFYGNCEFRNVSEIPNDAIIMRPNEAISLLNRLITNEAPINYANKDTLIQLLNGFVTNGANPQIRTQHTQYVRHLLHNTPSY